MLDPSLVLFDQNLVGSEQRIVPYEQRIGSLQLCWCIVVLYHGMAWGDKAALRMK